MSMFKETYPSKIRVAFYPYTYVRVMAMKGKLYQKKDYDKLLKMQASEIATYLESGDYQQDIETLGKELSGYALVEAAIDGNLVRRLQKLQKISSPSMRYLIHAHLKMYDVYNIKTILRAKSSSQTKDSTAKLLLPLGLLTKDALLALLDEDSLENILKKVGCREKAFAGSLAYYNKEHSLLELENFLDKEYYAFLFNFIGLLAGEHVLFKELLRLQIDVLNISLVLRLKKNNMEYERIRAFFFAGGFLFPLTTLHALAKRDFRDMITALEHTKIKHIIKDKADELRQKDLRGFETALETWLLRQTTLLLHQFPLSVDTILGYMFAKEIEVKNLRTLIKGKQLGLEEDFLSKQLVIE